MIIDEHVHLGEGEKAVRELLEAADGVGIDKLVVFSGRGDGEGNGDVLQAARAHPDRFIPFGWFRLGHDQPTLIDEMAQKGFKGIKFIRPASDYNDLRYFPVYERCAERNLVGLFHTGIVGRRDAHKFGDVDTERMRPIKLDRVLRRFTDWPVVIAHMGNPWHDEAAMMLRWHHNLYSDLSGSTLKYRSPGYLKGVLWWGEDETYRDKFGRAAFEKIVFGTDVSPSKMQEVYNDYQRLFEAIALSAEVRAKVMGGTMAGLLGLE